MKSENYSKLFMAIFLAGIMSFTSSVCKTAESKPKTDISTIAVIAATPAKKQTTTKEHLSALEKITNDIDRLKFDMFKSHLEKGLKHTSKVIPQLKQKNESLPSSVNQEVMTIEKTLPRIKAAKTPEELIKEESTAFNAAISALKTINNKNKDVKTKPAITSKLASAETMIRSLTATNYKIETKKIFKAIHYSMKELHRSLKSK